MLKKISHISLFIVGLSMPLPLFALALGPLDTHQASLFSHFSGNIPIKGANVNLISSQTLIRLIAAKEYVDNTMQQSVKRLNARLVQNEQGQPSIKIFSDQPINDSILEFSLDFTWEGGRISRNYIVLLDPPKKPTNLSTGHQTNHQPTINSTPKGRQRHATASSIVKVKVTDSPFSQSLKAEKFRTDEQGKITYGPTDRTDTLSTIANRIRPENASSAQVMYVLFRENPRSFNGNDINRLKAGYTLTIENPDAIATISTQAAKRFLFPERYASTSMQADLSATASATDEQRQIEKQWLKFSQLKDEVIDAMSEQQANEQANDRLKQKIASFEALLPELSAQLEGKNALLEQTKKQTPKSTL